MVTITHLFVFFPIALELFFPESLSLTLTAASRGRSRDVYMKKHGKPPHELTEYLQIGYLKCPTPTPSQRPAYCDNSCAPLKKIRARRIATRLLSYYCRYASIPPCNSTLYAITSPMATRGTQSRRQVPQKLDRKKQAPSLSTSRGSGDRLCSR